MKKLLKGIVEFRRDARSEYREKFAHLALYQKPDALFVGCSDSRVVPNLFASTDPGDLFVLRNIGNIVPPCGKGGVSGIDESEFAVVEYAVVNLGVDDIIICGHSECGAMKAIVADHNKIETPHLRNWLRHGDPRLNRFEHGLSFDEKMLEHNRLSQSNVLTQLKHLKSYQLVSRAVDAGTLKLHGWWFDLEHADVYAFDGQSRKFVLIDENLPEHISRGI